jgi:hypothetical protein
MVIAHFLSEKETYINKWYTAATRSSTIVQQEAAPQHNT